MPGFSNIIYTRFGRPYYYVYVTIAVIILFIVASIYGYKWFYSDKQKNKEMKDVANASHSSKSVEIFFFNVDWCPHCKTAKPEWQSFSDEYNGKNINGYVISCSDKNCTNDTDPNISYLINEYKIESYPTVKMQKDNKQIEFDAKITKSALKQFVESVTSD